MRASDAAAHDVWAKNSRRVHPGLSDMASGVCNKSAPACPDARTDVSIQSDTIHEHRVIDFSRACCRYATDDQSKTEKQSAAMAFALLPAERHIRMNVKQTVDRDRREVLYALGSLVAVGVLGCGESNGSPTSPSSTSSSAVSTNTACVVTPALTEGPYFVDELLNRSDIRTDPATGATKAGVPLSLGLRLSQISSSGTCVPLAGALVDVWHCDASGLYSDVSANNTVGQKFLRGYQVSDANGAVQFTTIYPGWYQGRAVHIHFKVRMNPGGSSGLQFTSQLFFDETLTDQVFTQSPYNARGRRDTTNQTDGIYQGGGTQLLVMLSSSAAGYAGTFNVSVRA
jgi:protocatechuate 3,4-dioxygenase beta subunit